jgi:hypothetical protein
VRLQRLGSRGKSGPGIDDELFQLPPERVGVEVELLLRIAHPLGKLARQRPLGQEAEPGQALLKKIAQTLLQAVLQVAHPTPELRGIGDD